MSFALQTLSNLMLIGAGYSIGTDQHWLLTLGLGVCAAIPAYAARATEVRS